MAHQAKADAKKLGTEKAVTSAESGQILNEQSSVSFQDMLSAAGLSEEYTLGDGEVAFDEVARGLSELKRLKDDTKAPDTYDLSLPPDFQGPDGMQWQPDPDFAKAITKIANEAGLQQGAMSNLVTAYATHQMNKLAQSKAKADEIEGVRQQEFQKLGPQAQQRVEGVRQAIAKQYGLEGPNMITAKSAQGVEILEDLLAKAGAAGRMAPARPGLQQKPLLSGLIGKKGGARALLNMANTGKG